MPCFHLPGTLPKTPPQQNNIYETTHPGNSNYFPGCSEPVADRIYQKRKNRV